MVNEILLKLEYRSGGREMNPEVSDGCAGLSDACWKQKWTMRGAGVRRVQLRRLWGEIAINFLLFPIFF